MSYCASLKTTPPRYPRPSRIGIDAFCILYLFRDNTEALEAYLRGLLSHGHTLTIVVDSRAAKEKQDTVVSRRSARAAAAAGAEALTEFIATPEFDEMSLYEQQAVNRKLLFHQRDAWRVKGVHLRTFASLAETLGLTWVMAESEADETLAALSKSGAVQIVISSDSDLLVLGVETLWIPSVNGAHAQLSGLDVRRFVGLAGDRMYELAFLAGCDVHPQMLAPIAVAISWLRVHGSLAQIHARFPDKVTESDMADYAALRAPGACWGPPGGPTVGPPGGPTVGPPGGPTVGPPVGATA